MTFSNVSIGDIVLSFCICEGEKIIQNYFFEVGQIQQLKYLYISTIQFS